MPSLAKKNVKPLTKLIDMCRKYASESSCATNPIIFEPMTMSILLAQQKKINELEKKLVATTSLPFDRNG
jgi:hypothetical protein